MSVRSAPVGVAIALGLITLLGPASVDMYLPFIPAMAADLKTPFATMQLTLTVFLLAQGGGQLVFGPVIDAFGRRRPLLIALLVFAAASVWAAATPSASGLIFARFIQGLAASLALVTAMSTVRDVSEGVRAAQLFAMLMTIQGVGPVLAPAIGGVIGATLGWRAVFGALALLGLVVLANCLVALRETLPVEKRSSLNLLSVARTYRSIIFDPKFIAPGLSLSFVFFFLFAYIGGVSYVYQAGYGVSERAFGFIFGATGFALLLGAIASARLAAGFKLGSLALAGVLTICAGVLVGLGSVLFDIGLPGIVAGMFIALAGVGIAEATLVSIALSTRDRAIGASAAILGALPTMFGAAATPLAAALAEIGPVFWLSFLGAAALIAAALTWTSVRIIAIKGVKIALQH